MLPMSGMSTGPPGASPEKTYREPLGWLLPIPGVGWCMQRTTASLSATFAVFASSSVNRRPGTTVSIGLNGLRCSATASGLGSKVSICDTPPCSKITRTFFAFAGPASTSRSAAIERPGSSAEAAPIIPSWRKLRRGIRS